MSDRPMFSRDELLGGMPARRASTVLFAIEAHTARLVAGSRIERATFVGQRTVAEREQAFFAAVASGRHRPVRLTVQDLERHAPGWAALAGPNPEMRASLARLIGAKYRLPRGHVPRLRAALGIDDQAVRRAYERLHDGASIDTVFAPRTSVPERLRWWRAAIATRLEDLPPFWVAYFLALTETIGEGILIVPVAVAGVGPIAGVVLLLILGIANLTTLGALAESVTRNGSMRYGAAYFGRLVRELLGDAASTTMTIALGVFNLVVFLVYLLGFSSVIAGATGINEAVWAAVLFAINVYVLRRESLDETIASAVLIGIVNVSLVVAITAIAAAYIEPANLTYHDLPVLDGRPPDAGVIGLIFGVILVSFFGHTSVANVSKTLLARDPSGRALLYGNLAALATVIVLYCAAVLAIGGALGPEPLVGTRGTAITPLAVVAGPIIHVLGSIYVVLAIGLGSLYVSLGLYNQVMELLPSPRTGGDTRLARIARDRRQRLLVGLAPAATIFVILEILIVTDNDWFAGPIGIIGVLAVPLVGGVFPMLLVVAARRRGEYVPGQVIGLLGHPITATLVIALFLAGIVAHGWVIWQSPVERGAALAVAGLTIALIAWIWRHGAFRRRAVVELRHDPAGRRAAMVVAGRTDTRAIALDGSSSGASAARIDLDGIAVDRLRIWVHDVSLDGWSTERPSRVSIVSSSEPGPAGPSSETTSSLEEIDLPAGPLAIHVSVPAPTPDLPARR